LRPLKTPQNAEFVPFAVEAAGRIREEVEELIAQLAVTYIDSSPSPPTFPSPTILPFHRPTYPVGLRLHCAGGSLVSVDECKKAGGS
jgi:hypothetical protein